MICIKVSGRSRWQLRIRNPIAVSVIESLKGTIQVPTLRLNSLPLYSPIRRPDWRDALSDVPEALANQWIETATFFAGQENSVSEQLSSWSLELVDAMQRAGVPIGAGTDTPIGQAIPGYSLHTELERLVDAGLSERQALFAATVVPAMFSVGGGHGAGEAWDGS